MASLYRLVVQGRTASLYRLVVRCSTASHCLVNICQCLFTFYLCNFMLNNTHLLLLACAFVSRFDYNSIYGSFNKVVLINLPKADSYLVFISYFQCLKFSGFPW